MKREEFKQLFTSVLDEAVSNTERLLNISLSKNRRIELHGAGHPGDIVDPEAALDSLYLGEDRFWVVVNVGVKEIAPNSTTIWVAASGHHPVPFEKTWNNPPGQGPFKQVFGLIQFAEDPSNIAGLEQITFDGLREVWKPSSDETTNVSIEHQIADLKNIIRTMNAIRAQYGDAQINAVLAGYWEELSILEKSLDSGES